MAIAILTAIGAGVKAGAKGIGALARGVRNRRIIKAGGTPILSKRKLRKAGAGTLSKGISANRQARIDKRAGKKAERLKTGGGFLRRAITQRRAKKSAGLLKRQIRKKNKYGQPVDPGSGTGTDPGQNFLGSGGAGAFFTGGEAEPEPEPKAETGGIMEIITKNWLVILLVGAGLWLLSKVLKSKKR